LGAGGAAGVGATVDVEGPLHATVTTAIASTPTRVNRFEAVLAERSFVGMSILPVPGWRYDMLHIHIVNMLLFVEPQIGSQRERSIRGESRGEIEGDCWTLT
jgi:hypothetical protein